MASEQLPFGGAIVAAAHCHAGPALNGPRPTMSPRSRVQARANAGAERGFTLLEAMVALALIAGAGMALFAWINTSLQSLTRVQEVNARAEATVNVLEYMARVNPLIAPEGVADLGVYRFAWKATPITALQDGANYPRGVSLYRLALFETRVSITKAAGSWFDISLRQVGYKKVREPARPF